MLNQEKIINQISQVLDQTDFQSLGVKYSGKVRDCYAAGDRRYLITTDRLSCFDRIVTTVPFKGQVLNQMAVNWFQQTSSIVENHLLDCPDPNVMLVKSCEIFPVEVVVRGYLTGSAWRDYSTGQAVSGIQLPKGMKLYEKFETPLITPSTKAPQGAHDLPISEAEIVSSGLVTDKLWSQTRQVALELFKFGQIESAKRGLIMVDTKYEFGIYQGKLVLADEIHTLDCSRYWKAASYPAALSTGESPEMLDKQPIREWLISQNFRGDGPIPKFTEQYRAEIATHYINAYELITGQAFQPVFGNVSERIKANLKIS